MSTLRKLQKDFIDAVFHDMDNGFHHNIPATEESTLPGKRRLRIYHNNIFISLTAALKAVYPVINKLVGEEFFEYAANEFISHCPSSSGNLHDYGIQFPEFIHTFPAASELDYLSDVAQLEWAYHSVFHAADYSSLDITRLQSVTENEYGQLKFTLNPAARLIQSTYPILDIWQANQDDNIQSEENTIDLDSGSIKLLVIRRGLDVEFEILSDGEFIFLDGLRNDLPFATVCELTQSADPACDISKIFQRHIQQNTIVDFSL